MTLRLSRYGVHVVACLSLVTSACSTPTEEEVETVAAVTVKTAPVTRGDIRGTIHATGIVSPAPGAELIVVAPEPARVVDVSHGAGERVRRGDVLVRFEIPTSAAEEQKQQAEVTRAEAGVENAKAAHTRARDLFDRGVSARRDVEDVTRAVADAEAALAQARAALTSARTVAGRSTVRATFDGVVVKRFHNPGDLVEAAASDPVLRIVDQNRLEVIASVSVADAQRVALDAAAHLLNAPTDTPDVPMKVVSRPTAVEAGTATVPVRLGFVRTVSIPVGAAVQIDIDAEQHRDVLLIPVAAIVREGEETAAFVAIEGKAQRRVVQLGLSDGTQVEIVSGIKSDERVVVDGQAGLPDGAAITEGPATPSGAKGGSPEKDDAK